MLDETRYRLISLGWEARQLARALNQEKKLMEKQWMSRDKFDEALEETLEYVIRVGDATSQLINVAVLFGDNANESVSGRSHRLKDKSKAWAWLGASINFVFDDDHCERAYNNDVTRAAKTLNESKPKKKTTKK
jgi:hypothetical protein